MLRPSPVVSSPAPDRTCIPRSQYVIRLEKNQYNQEIGFGVQVSGADSEVYQKPWASWNAIDADTLHLEVTGPDSYNEYTIPIAELLIADVNYPTMPEVDAALILFFAIPVFVKSVTGLDVDNTDQENPVVRIADDNVTITGDGTPGSPLVAAVGPGGSSIPKFQRNLTADVTLEDGECLVSVDYINTGDYNLILNGDSAVAIL